MPQAKVSSRDSQEVTIMNLDLPEPKQTRESIPSRRLIILGNVAPIPRLIDEKHNQNEIKTTDSKHQPENRSPRSRPVNDEVTKHWATVRREEEETRPEADFSCMFVEEEHVFDEC